MLVAFHGKRGSGKDTAGKRLAAMTALPTVQISFARKLKESYAALYDVPVEILEEWKNDPTAVVQLWVGGEFVKEHNHRVGLMRKGTEAGRDVFGYDFWVNQGLAEYDANEGADVLFYVTDCRFPNEAQAIQDRDGAIFLVEGLDEYEDTHISEAGLPARFIDEVIDNSVRDDNFAFLDRQLRDVAKAFGIPLLPWA